MHNRRTLTLPVIRFVVLVAATVCAGPVPILDLDQLTESADEIVVGGVTSIVERGRTVVKAVDGQEQPARSMTGEMKVDRVLKGPAASTVTFHFLLPETPNGYSGISVLSYRILFLKRQVSGTYEFASPYYPSLPAVAGSPPTGNSSIEQVLGQLLSVVTSSHTSEEQRREAIFDLSRSRVKEATDLLQRAFNQTDSMAKLEAAAALLERNDIMPLDVVEDALLRQRSVPPYLLHNLSYAIAEGLKDERAIPALGRLLASPQAEIRRSAVSALWHTGSSSAIPFLTTSLWDSDSEARYYAVVGLAEITGQNDWRPLVEEFKSNQSRYLAYWRDWARANK